MRGHFLRARGGIDPLWRLAGSAPAVDFNFSSGSMLDKVSGQDLITFTRPSTAWGWNGSQFVEFANDVPRIVVDPATGLRGLLVEEARTNIFWTSRGITSGSSGWTNSLATAANSTSIFGSNGIGTVDTPAGNLPTVYRAFTCTPSTTYTLSFYVRLGTLPASDFRFALRDDTAGAFVEQNIVPNITPSADEWRRVVYTFTTPVGCTLIRPYLYRFLAVTGGTVSFDQAQVETGAFPTSPIITTGSALTRSADVASVTGANFSGWFNASAGTIYAHNVIGRQATTSNRIVSMSDGTGDNMHRLQYRGSGATQAATFVSSVAVADLTPYGVIGANTPLQQAYAYSLDDFAASGGGAAPVIDTLGALPTVNQLEIGLGPDSGVALNGIIPRITIWPTRLPDATLQALTAP